MTPEPEDKLDAVTNVVVNGPEGEILDWREFDWRAVEESVRRLRQRIFTASQACGSGSSRRRRLLSAYEP